MVEELTLIDKTLEEGTPARLIAPDENLWGPNCFTEIIEGEPVLNKFIAEVQTTARYAVGSISNI